jgi:hypothetical protein
MLKKGLLIHTTHTMEVRAKVSARLAMLGGTIAQHAPRNPNGSRAAESKTKKRGGKTEDWSPRKRGRPRTKKGEAGGKEEGQSKGDETHQSDCTMTAGETLAQRVIARIRRATAYRVDYSDNADLGDYESD